MGYQTDRRPLTMLETVAYLGGDVSTVYCNDCVYWIPCGKDREESETGMCCRYPVGVTTSEDHGCGEYVEHQRETNRRTTEDEEDARGRQCEHARQWAALGLGYLPPDDEDPDLKGP